MTDLAIQALGVQKSYRGDGVVTPVLRGLDLCVPAGKFVAIMGPSGCGKSTLLHILGLMMKPDAGQVTLVGKAIHDLSAGQQTMIRRKVVGFVFQRFNLLSSISALANVKLAARLRGVDTRTTPAEMLELVGLTGQARRRPGQLSIGEQQRVAIARAMIGRPPLLLADEPTGNLDSDNSHRILDLIRRLHDQFGQTTVMITHSQSAADVADVVHQMKDGLLAK
ncbi:MAG: ABC transporter ATP-binding protein [Phycisphaerae bacterium]|nr:ABC transporter ATP-binding protein [Phycisphaerae bacterium]